MYVFIIMRCVIVNDSQQDTAAFRLRLPRTKLYKCFERIGFCTIFAPITTPFDT